MNDPAPISSAIPPADARLPRRTVFKWFAAVAAAMQVGDINIMAADAPPRGAAPPAVANGYGTDPKLNDFYKPGSFWALTMTPAQLATTIALADVIIPADKLGPAASAVRVQDFIDEWISAPYPSQVNDRSTILPGLDWLEAETQKRFTVAFDKLTREQQHQICDDICNVKTAKPEFKQAAGFFSRFRSLAASAYYATPEGWRAIGYVGNMPLVTFDGPPESVLKRLNVEQTVK